MSRLESAGDSPLARRAWHGVATSSSPLESHRRGDEDIAAPDEGIIRRVGARGLQGESPVASLRFSRGLGTGIWRLGTSFRRVGARGLQLGIHGMAGHVDQRRGDHQDAVALGAVGEPGALANQDGGVLVGDAFHVGVGDLWSLPG